VRIAATADLHFSPENYAKLKDQFERVREEADVLVLAGDLTNYGQPSEMEPLLNVLVRLRLPTVVVLGNHDYECGMEEDLVRMMVGGGIKVLDGTEGPIIAATDYMKSVPDQLAPWLGTRMVTLGTDGFGRSDNRQHLRRHFEVNAETIAASALSQLARLGKFDAKKAQKALGELGVNPEKADPAKA